MREDNHTDRSLRKHEASFASRIDDMSSITMDTMTANRSLGYHKVRGLQHPGQSPHVPSNLMASHGNLGKPTTNSSARPEKRSSRNLRFAFPIEGQSQTDTDSQHGPLYRTTSTHSQDRFIPRAKGSLPTTKLGSTFEVLGTKTNRILEFGAAPPLQRKFAPVDFVSQYSLQAQTRAKLPERRVSQKPIRVLDAPGLVNDFYINVLDWSVPANIMAIGLNSYIYAWNSNSEEVTFIADLQDYSAANQSMQVSSLKWSQEDACLAVSTSTGSIQLWNATNNTLLRTMSGRRDRVAAMGWNDHILSAGGRDGNVWNHDVRLKNHKVSQLRGHTGEICGLAWRSDGRFLATGGNDNLVNIWDVRVTTAPVHQLTQHQAAIKALAWCPWHSNLLATGGGFADRMINFWNCTSGHRVNQIDAQAQVTSLHWSEAHREVAATLSHPLNSITSWSYPSLEKRAIITEVHDDRILGATISSDGQTLVTSSGDESLKMWNLFESVSKSPHTKPTLSSLSMRRI